MQEQHALLCQFCKALSIKICQLTAVVPQYLQTLTNPAGNRLYSDRGNSWFPSLNQSKTAL